MRSSLHCVEVSIYSLQLITQNTSGRFVRGTGSNSTALNFLYVLQVSIESYQSLVINQSFWGNKNSVPLSGSGTTNCRVYKTILHRLRFASNIFIYKMHTNADYYKGLSRRLYIITIILCLSWILHVHR